MKSGPNALFLGSSEMSQRVRSLDWAGTVLGPTPDWPQSLRTAVSILLTSRYAMWMGWGDQLAFIYNDAYRPTLGIKHPWALGSPASEVWTEIWPDIGPRIHTVLSTGEATYDEGLLLILKRSEFPEETYHTFSYSPLADDNGTVSGMFCVVTEETERVISERRMATLRDLAAELAACNTETEVLTATASQLGRNTKDLPFTLVYLFDADGGATLATATGINGAHPAAAQHVHSERPWPADQILLQPVPMVVEDLAQRWLNGDLPTGAWDKPPDQAAIFPIKQQGHDRPAGFLVAALNPYRRYEEAYSGFVDLVAGQIAAALANARAYEEERRRAEALAELDRAKTQFFSNVSHEFRTPLTLMLGPLEDALSASGELPADLQGALTLAHRNGLRLLRLVNSLLDFSRIEAGRVKAVYEATDLSAFTTELASNFRSALERAGLFLNIDCPTLPEPVYVDREMWEKVVLNLLSNAFKFTFVGGINVTLRQAGAQVELSIADTGTGIPEHELPFLFKRFHRVQGARGRTHEGSGIGLALVQELVRLHGGSIRVESTFGQGSTFTASLPLGVAHLAPENVRATHQLSNSERARAFVEEALRWLPGEPVLDDSDAIPTSEKAGHVLLVEDNADMRDYIRRLLARRYHVQVATDGIGALALVSEQRPDLVLSDVMMPGLDGFGLLAALRARPETRTVPVILLSARAGEEARSEGMDAGADDYLVKPFSARELQARVGAHLKLARARKEAEEQASGILESITDGFLAMDRDWRLTYVNAEAERLNNMRREDMVGRSHWELYPAAVGTTVYEELMRSAAERVPVEFENFYAPWNRWFHLKAYPTRDGGMSVFFTDITKRKKAEEALRRSNEELKIVNSELEEFAYVASHDMQEPLRMVNIYTQLLLKKFLTDQPQARSYADYVQQGVAKMEELIRDLLKFSRTVHFDEPVGVADLSASLNEAMAVLENRITESGAIIRAEALPTLPADTAQMAHVFQNLLSNSLKYSKKGVVPEIQIRVKYQANDCIVSVADNGIGFEPQYAERIFGLFKRLHKDEYPGTGLGLAICQRIVQRYGGKMWAEGRSEGGATFYFSLPLTVQTPVFP